MSVNVVTTESAAFILDATVVVIPVYPHGSRIRWLRFSATMYVFCGSCHPLHCSYTMWSKVNFVTLTSGVTNFWAKHDENMHYSYAAFRILLYITRNHEFMQNHIQINESDQSNTGSESESDPEDSDLED